MAANDPCVVVLQLTGGNDYLNTVIPYNNALYRDNRKAVSIGDNQIVHLDKTYGFPSYLAPMKQFWDEPMAPYWMKVDGKIACAFSSSGGWGGGTELACQSLLTVLLNFGFLVFGVTDYASKLTTAHYGAITAREPREEGTQAACRLLGKRLAEWVAVFCDSRKDQHPLTKPDVRLPPG